MDSYKQTITIALIITLIFMLRNTVARFAYGIVQQRNAQNKLKTNNNNNNLNSNLTITSRNLKNYFPVRSTFILSFLCFIVVSYYFIYSCSVVTAAFHNRRANNNNDRNNINLRTTVATRNSIELKRPSDAPPTYEEACVQAV